MCLRPNAFVPTLPIRGNLLRIPGNMAKPRNDFVDRLQYIALRTVSMLLHCFPVNANLQTARLLGNLMYAVDRKHRERALGNLKRSFPEMPEAQRQEMARRSMQQMFMLFVEVLFTTRLVHIDTWRKYCDLENFQETLQLLLKRKQGLILLTGHYGNWEILGYVLATLGFETTSIARPLDNPYVNQWLLGVREKKGQRIIAKKGATEDVVQVLENGGAVGFIADQNAGTKGMFVDFFGRKASTYKSIGLLAMQFEVPVVIGFARRTNDQFLFKVKVQDVIHPEDWKPQDDPLRYITQRYTRAIEDFVREDPGQYLWVHRRWKTRPKGETPEAFD
jgi:Kdo2-lipid IVA lauroyltransferase/acyltransferase